MGRCIATLEGYGAANFNATTHPLAIPSILPKMDLTSHQVKTSLPYVPESPSFRTTITLSQRPFRRFKSSTRPETPYWQTTMNVGSSKLLGCINGITPITFLTLLATHTSWHTLRGRRLMVRSPIEGQSWTRCWDGRRIIRSWSMKGGCGCFTMIVK